VQGVVGTV